MADDKKLLALREDTLKREDLTKEQRETLIHAKPGDALRQALATTLAKAGREMTQGTETKQAVVELKNELIKTGELLVTPINEIKDLVKKIAGVTGDVGHDFRDALVSDTEGRAAPRMAHKRKATADDEKSFVESFGDAFFPERKAQTAPRMRRLQKEPAAADQTAHQRITLNPLEVVHRNAGGEVIRREHLPTAKIEKVAP